MGGNGTEVALALRPEVVRIGDGGGSNRLAGKVLDVAFLGSVVRLRVELPAGAGIVSLDTFNDPASPPPAIGAPLAVSFPPSALMPLDAAAIARTEAAAALF